MSTDTDKDAEMNSRRAWGSVSSPALDYTEEDAHDAQEVMLFLSCGTWRKLQQEHREWRASMRDIRLVEFAPRVPLVGDKSWQPHGVQSLERVYHLALEYAPGLVGPDMVVDLHSLVRAGWFLEACRVEGVTINVAP